MSGKEFISVSAFMKMKNGEIPKTEAYYEEENELVKLLSILRPVFYENMKSGASQINKTMMHITPMLIENMKLVSVQARVISDYIAPILVDIGKIFKYVQRPSDIMISAGWWIVPSMKEMPGRIVNEAIIKYREGDTNALTRLFVEMYSKNEYLNLKAMVNSWYGNKVYLRRSVIINEALKAHILGMYALSIPALLAQAEGVAEDICALHGLDIAKIQSKGRLKLQKALNIYGSKRNDWLFGDTVLPLIEKVYFERTSELYKNSNASKNRNKILNRHGILHGRILKYNTKSNSLRCFFMLDALSRTSNK